MTPQDELIAEAAVRTPRAATFDQLDADISKEAGLPLDVVQPTLKRLLAEFVLKAAVTPARNVSAGEVRQVTMAWYEKDQGWD